jgi:hypothetical protein
MTRRLIGLGVGLVVLSAGGATWRAHARAPEVSVDSLGDQVQTLARGQLPAFADTADVRRLYAFARDNADTLTWMPCTCGCGTFGHTSNRVCYIKGEGAGRVTFTSHAAT